MSSEVTSGKHSHKEVGNDSNNDEDIILFDKN